MPAVALLASSPPRARARSCRGAAWSRPGAPLGGAAGANPNRSRAGTAGAGGESEADRAAYQRGLLGVCNARIEAGANPLGWSLGGRGSVVSPALG